MSENPIIHQATFNPKVKAYIFLVCLFFLIVSIIGWVILPFWIFGLGQWLSNKFFHTLKCELSQKQLKFSKGLIVHIEKTIPLENIQDLAFIGGPILRWFGLTLIRVETAGGGGPHAHNQMSMIGVNDAENFKIMILNQREKVIREKNQQAFGGVAASTTGDLNDKLLIDIKNELIEIKQVLKTKN